jgi:hypothetical protein
MLDAWIQQGEPGEVRHHRCSMTVHDSREQTVDQMCKRLILLRWTRTVTLVIAPLLLPGVITTSNTDGQSRQDDPHPSAATRGVGQQQSSAKPPATPPKNQSAPQTSQTDTGNHPAAQDSKPPQWGPVEWSAVSQAISAVLVAVFTGFLVWYSHRGWTVAKQASEASRVSADAAKQSAGIARDALVLTNRPYLDVKGFKLDDLSDKSEQPPMLQITCKIFNPSSTPANVAGVEVNSHVLLTPDMQMSNRLNLTQVTIAPGRAYAFPMTFKPLTPVQREHYALNALSVDLSLRVTFVDPLGTKIRQYFDRTCLCGPDGRLKVLLTSQRLSDWPPDEQ